MAKLDGALQRAMAGSLRAFANGDAAFFSYIKDDARIYTLESSSPIVGRKAFQAYFGTTFKKLKRKIIVVNNDVQLSGGQAILSQTLQITANEVSSHVRQTVVWQRSDRGVWQMAHIHNAAVGQPVITGKLPKGSKAVEVLNERIATVAATVGVAQ